MLSALKMLRNGFFQCGWVLQLAAFHGDIYMVAPLHQTQWGGGVNEAATTE